MNGVVGIKVSAVEKTSTGKVVGVQLPDGRWLRDADDIKERLDAAVKWLETEDYSSPENTSRFVDYLRG